MQVNFEEGSRRVVVDLNACGFEGENLACEYTTDLAEAIWAVHDRLSCRF